ncbi:diacylglycerol acyltransferase [Fluviicoccus keumensis]|uniref:Diacylglycerol acyltransferase n=1 Tax=Fluviicoccus keumensis TaxID=1435465 RepID=A0A4Q7ZAE0_9GAMM|nr:lysophospholipid acyltransferase family protein [Fluviicoccus keumensis]RZU46855.1 diacylglycerol acyltransferase [Fluviicoccus keumensis]
MANAVVPFTPPPLSQVRSRLALMNRWFAPRFFGLENLDPARPALYVGNHTLYGTLDGPLMLLGLYEKKGIFLRSLGDHIHFKVPGWRRMLVENGVVAGTPENCSALMAAGEHILVYPGGGREVMKNKGEEYRLVWKNRTGFARMALEHGYDIIPFAAVGADDTYRIRYDANDFNASRVGRLLRRSGITDRYLRGGDAFAPLATGLAGTPLPRPERFYFAFGERISLSPLQARAEETEVQWQVREQVANRIYSLMNELFARRDAEQPQWPLWRRKLIQR